MSSHLMEVTSSLVFILFVYTHNNEAKPNEAFLALIIKLRRKSRSVCFENSQRNRWESNKQLAEKGSFMWNIL